MMILVYFRGYGEWFFRDNNRKLAVTRTTTTPYRDPRKSPEIKAPEIFLGYEEWLAGLEDSDENFSEWAHEYERQKEIHEATYAPEFKHYASPGEYDLCLRGIFAYDDNAEGDVYDTDGLKSYGVDHMMCPYIEGVFKLINEDEKHFRITKKDPKKDWGEFRKVIKKLIPCKHPESAFYKLVSLEKLAENDFDSVYFEIQTKLIRDLYGRSQPILPADGENTLDFINMDDSLYSLPSGYKNVTKNKDDVIFLNEISNEKAATYKNVISVLICIISGEFTGIPKHPCFLNKKDFEHFVKKHFQNHNMNFDECLLELSIVLKPSDCEQVVEGFIQEENYLMVIGILLNFILGKFENICKHPYFKNQIHLIEEIYKQYEGYYGLSKSNLSRLFPKAKKS